MLGVISMPTHFTCPHCHTELSDADVDNGICPVCNKPIEGSAGTVDLGNDASLSSDSLGDLQTAIDPQAATVQPHPSWPGAWQTL